MSELEIKICGLSTPEAIDAAVDAGATHVGLVHHAPSPRHLTLEQAKRLRARVPERVKVVLLLVNQEPLPTIEALRAVNPDVVQFHGSEAPAWIALVKQMAPFEIWKAVGLRDAASLDFAATYAGAVDRILYDAPAGALPGGNGLLVDYGLLAGHRHALPWGLAGGLNPGNVGEAIRATGAPLVDTSTGVESAPGTKDPDKIRAFCQAARAA